MENNKFLKKYIPVLTMRETQEAQELIVNLLKEELINNLNVILVRSPRISSKRQYANFSSLDGKRSINFDSSNNNNIYYIFNRYKYWFINIMKDLDVKNNNGVMSIINYVERDNVISNIKSMEENTLQIEYRFDIKDEIFKKSKDLAEKIYEIFLKIEKIISNKYKLEETFPKKISSKELKKIIKNPAHIEEVKSMVASEKSMYFLINKLSSNEIRFDHNFEITLESYSKEIDSSFSILTIKDRKTLEDLKPFVYKTDRTVEEYRFAKEILDNKDIRTLNITIDIDLLAMVILKKAHILELQSGRNSKEIEKFFNTFNINHL